MTRFYVLLNSFAVISGRCRAGECVVCMCVGGGGGGGGVVTERLCAMEPHLQLKNITPLGIDLGNARSAGQRYTS